MKLLFAFISFFAASTLIGQTIITFDNQAPDVPVSCNETWTESGITQILVPDTPSSSCGFDYSSGSLSLSAKYILDLAIINDISSIEIDLNDGCSGGCTTVDLFENGNLVGTIMTSTWDNQTLVYDNSAMDQIDEMAIYTLEAQLFEIRIFSDPLCNDANDVEIWIEDGDVYLEDACNGIILTAPNGNCYRVRVDNNGGLVSNEVNCP